MAVSGLRTFIRKGGLLNQFYKVHKNPLPRTTSPFIICMSCFHSKLRKVYIFSAIASLAGA
jgi:hypothetical protein